MFEEGGGGLVEPEGEVDEEDEEDGFVEREAEAHDVGDGVVHEPEGQAPEGEGGAVHEGEEAGEFEEEAEAEESLGGGGVVGDEFNHALGGLLGGDFEVIVVSVGEVFLELDGDIGDLGDPFAAGIDEFGDAGSDVCGGDELLGVVDEEGGGRFGVGGEVGIAFEGQVGF